MLRFLSIPVLILGFVMFFAVQPWAGEQGQPTIVKVYKAPG